MEREIVLWRVGGSDPWLPDSNPANFSLIGCAARGQGKGTYVKPGLDDFPSKCGKMCSSRPKST